MKTQQTRRLLPLRSACMVRGSPGELIMVADMREAEELWIQETLSPTDQPYIAEVPHGLGFLFFWPPFFFPSMAGRVLLGWGRAARGA